MLTERGSGIELEYGKNKETKKSNFAEYMINTVLNNQEHFKIGDVSKKIYAEVVSNYGEFNFASYFTLLKSNFVPVKRPLGDGIKFLFNEALSDESVILNDVVDAYKNYEQASKKEKSHKESKTKDTSITLFNSSQSTSEDGAKTDSLLAEKNNMAELFEITCKKHSPVSW